MIHEYQLRILPEQAASEQSLKQYIGREKGLDVRTINAIRVLKRSIDARQRTIYVNLTIRVFVNETPSEEEFKRTDYPNVEGRPAVIVVGAGPGGLFAALKLIELGLRPIVIERGKNVRERKEDLARISREHKVDAESNYSFGEGGAGAYSDGKRRKNIKCILPARSQSYHFVGRSSAYRDGQASQSYRKHAQHHSCLWRRSALPDSNGSYTHRRSKGKRH